MLGDHFKKPLQAVMFRMFRAEIIYLPDDLYLGDIDMDRAGFKKGVMWKLHNEADPGLP